MTTMSEWPCYESCFVTGKYQVLTVEPESCFSKKTEVPLLFTHLDMEAHVIPELLAWFLAVRSQTAAFREVFCVRKILGFGRGPAIVVVQSCQKSCLYWITSIWRLISANNYCLNASIEVLISKKVLLQDFWGKNLSFSFWVL